MKTLLTINGTTLLLPGEINDQQMAGAIKLLRGAKTVDERTNYGPDGKLRYDSSAGYFTALVKRDVASSIRIELVDDSQVVTAGEFMQRVESYSKQPLPESVG